MLLIAGGKRDHNLGRLADAADDRGHPFRLLLHDGDSVPLVSWNPQKPEIMINGEVFMPYGTSLFIRYDIFSLMEKDSPPDRQRINGAWFDTLKGWAQASPETGLLNRHNENRETNKLRNLVMAKDMGLAIPETIVTNMTGNIKNPDDYIVKPVDGGAYTEKLKNIEHKAAPWFVQRRLNYPEMRIFIVGQYAFAFEIRSNTLDSRADPEQKITEITPPSDILEKIKKLSSRMGLDYGAADFKTCPDTGQWLFLEINTMPIFTGYDNIVNGRLSDAIFLTLRQMEGISAT